MIYDDKKRILRFYQLNYIKRNNSSYNISNDKWMKESQPKYLFFAQK